MIPELITLSQQLAEAAILEALECKQMEIVTLEPSESDNIQILSEANM